MFVVVISSIIRISTPVIDINLAQTTQEKLKRQTVTTLQFDWNRDPNTFWGREKREKIINRNLNLLLSLWKREIFQATKRYVRDDLPQVSR